MAVICRLYISFFIFLVFRCRRSYTSVSSARSSEVYTLIICSYSAACLFKKIIGNIVNDRLLHYPQIDLTLIRHREVISVSIVGLSSKQVCSRRKILNAHQTIAVHINFRGLFIISSLIIVAVLAAGTDKIGYSISVTVINVEDLTAFNKLFSGVNRVLIDFVLFVIDNKVLILHSSLIFKVNSIIVYRI